MSSYRTVGSCFVFVIDTRLMRSLRFRIMQDAFLKLETEILENDIIFEFNKSLIRWFNI